MVSQKYSECFCFNSNLIQTAQFVPKWKRNIVWIFLTLKESVGFWDQSGASRQFSPIRKNRCL
ncbi:hypothetical protein LEP1GSC062_3401 [Leptospira alexanderi serovar Manhao 3 str. L 60]|uniref:Uncharacterized protein n=1 Tax=Leptospira alexanderi serovar Manhao 3 str. L 60 TaxID=1049759 RepID=V6I7H5_9LEPT|nr:hypothetical protein LEP1GSC062_3401 [Leptospira alexanderi serovar Manhao 3 str. L 60]